MAGKKTAVVWAGCLLATCMNAGVAVAAPEASAAAGACTVSPRPAGTAPARQAVAVSRSGIIPGLGSIRADVGWDNAMQMTLIGADFEVARSFTPLTRQVQITVSGPEEELPLIIRFGGADGLSVARGTRVVHGTADPDALRSLVAGRAVAAFRERIGNYERRLIAGGRKGRVDDPHADGFLLAGAFVASLAGDPTAVGRARDLILQRIRGRVQSVRFTFKDCVTDYERYLLDIDQQRTNCIDAANDRDSWYVRAADRLGCEVEYMAQALAGEGQFISCTALGSVLT